MTQTKKQFLRAQQVWEAMSSPIRREILLLCAFQPHTQTQLMQVFSLSQPGLHKHVHILLKAGLLAWVQDPPEGADMRHKPLYTVPKAEGWSMLNYDIGLLTKDRS